MKNIIISNKQLKQLSEDINLSVDAKNNSASDYSNTLNSPNTIQDIQKVNNTSNDVNVIVGGPKSNDNSPVVDINVPVGSTAQNVISSTPELNTIAQNGGKFKVHGDGFPNECKVYTKKDIENARLNKMRNEGIVTTKDKLFDNI